MELYIRLKNGRPFEHPIFGDNFREAFPHIDTNNLPPEFAKFERVERPALGPYEIYAGVTYEFIDGVVKDVHHSRPMTPEEKLSWQNQVKSVWSQTGFASWIFDEETCSFKPPVPRPIDGKPYRWDEATISWIEVQPE